MSKPRYDWWSYIKAVIRRYPALKGKTLSGISMKENEAVRFAVEQTEALPNGAERLAVIDMVFWKQTHTLAGAAMQVPCSYDTAQQYHADFIKAVARNFKCDGLLEKMP